MSMGSAPSGSTATVNPLRNPAASNAWFHQPAPSSSAFFTSSGAPGSTQYWIGFTGSLAAAATRRLVREGEDHFHFGVLRKRFRARQVERAAAAIDPIGAGAKGAAGAVNVTEQKIGGVHEHAPAALGRHCEAPEHRFRE